MKPIIEGTVAVIQEAFYNVDDDPIIPGDSFEPPHAILYDTDNAVIGRYYASPTTVPATWEISASIPYMHLVDVATLKLEWVFTDDEGQIYRSVHHVDVMPANENRMADIVVYKRPTDNTISITLPVSLQVGDELILDINLNNESVMAAYHLETHPDKVVTRNKATFTLPFDVEMDNARLEPLAIVVEHVKAASGTRDFLTRNLWIVSSQVMVAINMLSNFVDKAKLEQTIPALEYATGDYINCLFRGLSMFNQYPPSVTSFTGMNMQGMMLESWLICSSYVALSTQMLAEGAHAFEFSGQDVNFNVDRTPSLEAALGRIQEQIENTVKPYKKLLGKASVIGGDGSIGSQAISAGRAFGRTSILNSPTSKLGRGLGPWIRSPSRVGGRLR